MHNQLSWVRQMPYLCKVCGHSCHVGGVRSDLLFTPGWRNLPRVVCPSFPPALLFCWLSNPALRCSVTYTALY